MRAHTCSYVSRPKHEHRATNQRPEPPAHWRHGRLDLRAALREAGALLPGEHPDAEAQDEEQHTRDAADDRRILRVVLGDRGEGLQLLLRARPGLLHGGRPVRRRPLQRRRRWHVVCVMVDPLRWEAFSAHHVGLLASHLRQRMRRQCSRRPRWREPAGR